jgi:predicted kinase
MSEGSSGKSPGGPSTCLGSLDDVVSAWAVRPKFILSDAADVVEWLDSFAREERDWEGGASMTGMLHLFCGKIASGKSTLAGRLAAEPGAVLLSEDGLLSTLYPGEIASLEDYVRMTRRLRAAIEEHLIALLGQGLTLVLGFQANTPTARAWMRSLAERSGAECRLHLIEVGDEECKARLRARNAAGEHAYQVSEETFDLFTSYFVPPGRRKGSRDGSQRRLVAAGAEFSYPHRALARIKPGPTEVGAPYLLGRGGCGRAGAEAGGEAGEGAVAGHPLGIISVSGIGAEVALLGAGAPVINAGDEGEHDRVADCVDRILGGGQERHGGDPPEGVLAEICRVLGPGIGPVGEDAAVRKVREAQAEDDGRPGIDGGEQDEHEPDERGGEWVVGQPMGPFGRALMIIERPPGFIMMKGG